jgi:hypothetical protein
MKPAGDKFAPRLFATVFLRYNAFLSGEIHFAVREMAEYGLKRR